MDNVTLRQKRDAEVLPHLEQYAPVWLFDEQILQDDESVVFSVVFHHNLYDWVKRRYEYDGFADVLYYLGENTISEEEALTVQNKNEPYITPVVDDSVNAYGG
jgi:hypothetical protein